MNGNLDDTATGGTVADDGQTYGDAATIGGVLTLDGTDDYIDFSSSADVNTGTHAERSISLWFKTDDGSGTQYLYAEGGRIRSLQIYTENGVLMAKGYNDPSDENNWDSANPTVLDTGIDVADGQWHHVVVSTSGPDSDPLHGLDPTGMKIYLDGTLEQSGTGGALWGHANAHIGSDYNGNKTFDGEIEEFQLFNQNLSASDVADIYATTATIGNSGDDTLAYDTVHTLFEGGDGNDTLLVGTSNTIDLSNVGDLSNIEKIHLENGASFSDKLKLSDVVSITDSSKTLTIDGDSSNSISLDNSLVNTGTTSNGYAIYQGASDPTVKVQVDEDIVVT
jgi:hypothetical protein